MKPENLYYKGKYRIPSTRLPGWDYGHPGAYFITICTHERQHFFGEIGDAPAEPQHAAALQGPQMILSPIGQWAHDCWAQIPNHFPHARLDEFIIMPNHMHGIIIIPEPPAGAGTDVAVQRLDEQQPPEEQPTTAPPPEKNAQMAAIAPKPGSISTIIRSYKSAVSKQARLINPAFAWQSRFHDHIIRNQLAYENIRHYIMNNVAKWAADKFNPEQTQHAAPQPTAQHAASQPGLAAGTDATCRVSTDKKTDTP